MGVPEVTAVPSKSYVAINSYKSDRSFPTTLCDLGRVSNIAAAVTLPRTSNFVNKNNVAQSVRNLPYKKRPISEVFDCTNSNSFHENVPTATSVATAISSHKKRRYSPESPLHTSALATQSTIKTNSDRNGVSNLQVKSMKLNSTETSNMVSSQNTINSVSYPQNSKRIGNTHLPFPLSTIQTLFLQPVQRRLQQTTVRSHLHKKQHDRLHDSNTNQLPNQHNVQLPSSEMVKLPTHHSLPMQLQQQNQTMSSQQTLQLPTPRMEQLPTHHSLPMQLQQQNQLMRSQQTLQLPTPRTEELPTHHSLPMQLQQQNQLMRSQQTLQLPTSTTEQLPTHHSLSMQLQQQNRLLCNENGQLQKQLSPFRQVIKNPQRLNQVITRLEQRVH